MKEKFDGEFSRIFPRLSSHDKLRNKLTGGHGTINYLGSKQGASENLLRNQSLQICRAISPPSKL